MSWPLARHGARLYGTPEQQAPPVHVSGTYVSLSTNHSPAIFRHLATWLPVRRTFPSGSVHEPARRLRSEAIGHGSYSAGVDAK